MLFGGEAGEAFYGRGDKQGAAIQVRQPDDV